MNKPKTLFTGEQFEQAYTSAVKMLQETALEPTSALKQAATDVGIQEGEPLKWFVTLANRRLFGKEENE